MQLRVPGTRPAPSRCTTSSAQFTLNTRIPLCPRRQAWAQNRCSQQEAFRILPAASSSRNIKRRELAVDLVVTVG